MSKREKCENEKDMTMNPAAAGENRAKRFLRQLCLMLVLLAALVLQGYGPAEAGQRTMRVLTMSGDNDFYYDAAATMRIFQGNRLATFPKREVRYYGCSGSTTADDVEELIQGYFGNAKDTDLNVFYYSGHGSDPYEGEASIEIRGRYGDGYSMSDLAERLADCRGKWFVIIDACFAESFYTDGIRYLPAKDRKRFTCLLSSADPEESYSLEYRGVQWSVFTMLMNSGLRISDSMMLPGMGRLSSVYNYVLRARGAGKMAADLNGNKKVTIGELARFLSFEMREFGFDMTPKLYGSNRNGVIFR